jgi:hypothetical protein
MDFKQMYILSHVPIISYGKSDNYVNFHVNYAPTRPHQGLNWVVTPFSVAVGYQRFRGHCCHENLKPMFYADGRK